MLDHRQIVLGLGLLAACVVSALPASASDEQLAATGQAAASDAGPERDWSVGFTP